ncbi:MAG TPA: hypothetical protein VFK40_11140 [Nitrososphaeraceae archaeon]|nr:hypothetical protein [Nitrososphaeraceae archaeon]
MLFSFDEILKAYEIYKQFKIQNSPPYHDRFIFPLFSGTYFCYRKIDVLRVISIAKSLSDNPTCIDVGCGNGDFLQRIRKYLPKSIGIEQNLLPFYLLKKLKPNFIYSIPIEMFTYEHVFDLAFVGWMQPGIDFRKHIAKLAKCIITTFDSGGQCGINGGCEYEEFGFHKIASWRTPSWIDVNNELMNKYYTNLSDKVTLRQHLSSLRTANNFWYVYSKDSISKEVKAALKLQIQKEEKADLISKERFDFEDVLDECGFGYYEKLSSLFSIQKYLWKVQFH